MAMLHDVCRSREQLWTRGRQHQAGLAQTSRSRPNKQVSANKDKTLTCMTTTSRTGESVATHIGVLNYLPFAGRIRSCYSCPSYIRVMRLSVPQWWTPTHVSLRQTDCFASQVNCDRPWTPRSCHTCICSMGPGRLTCHRAFWMRKRFKRFLS